MKKSKQEQLIKNIILTDENDKLYDDVFECDGCGEQKVNEKQNMVYDENYNKQHDITSCGGCLDCSCGEK